MTLNKLQILFCLITVMLLSACTGDIFEKDISEKTIQIFSPQNNLKTTSNQIYFWWHEIEGAQKYNIQIATPSFSQPQRLIMDSLVTEGKFVYTFTPGTYEWRVKAVNNASETIYSTQSFIIDTTSILSNLIVSTNYPVNNFLTKNKKVSFNWNALNSALTYNIIITNSTGGSIKDTTQSGLSYTYTFSQEGDYYWKVRALNNSSISQFSTNNKLTVDNTAPSIPALFSPSNGATVRDTNFLVWTRVGSGISYDSVFISSDSNFVSVLAGNKVYSNKIKINALQPTLLTSPNFYWWRVKSCDSLGNTSASSFKLKFKLQ